MRELRLDLLCILEYMDPTTRTERSNLGDVDPEAARHDLCDGWSHGVGYAADLEKESLMVSCCDVLE
jgi:hypothetical protein